jgi:hypothetical protein
MFRLYGHLQERYKYKNAKNCYNLTDPLIRNHFILFWYLYIYLYIYFRINGSIKL